MHQINFFATLFLSALVPLVLGFIWYHPLVFGSAWMKAGKFDPEKMKEGFNMPLVFGLTYLLGVFISFALSGIVIHQMGFFSMLQMHFKEQATQDFFKNGIAVYGNDFRTFKHGALHGAITGFGIALPVVAVNGLFERRGWTYILINAGFWILSITLMGAIICQFANLASLS